MSEVRVGEWWSGEEQRKHRRVPLGVSIECRSGATVVEGKAENVSVSGLLVRIPKTFSPDEQITVSFALPGTPQPIRSRARVAHVVPNTFIGLELLDLSVESRERIEKYVAIAAVPAGKQP